eukprot:947146-Prymnesium_polylepis.1
MHGPASMTLATSIARKRSASTHMRAHQIADAPAGRHSARAALTRVTGLRAHSHESGAHVYIKP